MSTPPNFEHDSFSNNPVNFVDPDGSDWIKNSETGQYGWRDDIKHDSEIPEGYRYIVKY
jgi:hypothetical protein